MLLIYKLIIAKKSLILSFKIKISENKKIMKINEAKYKHTFENASNYYFVNKYNETSVLEIIKNLSGYEVIYYSENQNFHRSTSGLKNMNAVKNYIKDFLF